MYVYLIQSESKVVFSGRFNTIFWLVVKSENHLGSAIKWSIWLIEKTIISKKVLLGKLGIDTAFYVGNLEVIKSQIPTTQYWDQNECSWSWVSA